MTVTAGYLILRPAGAEIVANDVVRIIEGRQLDKLWQFSPKEERQANNWSEEQFATFATTIAAEMQSQPITVTELSPGGSGETEQGDQRILTVSGQAWDRDNERHFAIHVADAPKHSSPVYLNLHKDEDGRWKVVVVDLIVQLNRLAHLNEPKTRWRILRDSIDSANLDGLTSITTGQTWTVPGFDEALKTGVAPGS